jgi:hypothetical protein
MLIEKIENMKGGWFIGNFEPSLFKTEHFEVGYKFYAKDELHEVHYHKIATEFNYLSRGKLFICGEIVNAGEFFILSPYETADLVFLEDCEILVVKVPSVSNDEYND